MFILDRRDVIVTGGFNVFPREVEDALATPPDVAVVAVIGIPDDKWGEAVTAIIVPKPGAEPDERQLIDLVEQLKGAIHAPKQVKFVSELGVGKVDKKALRAPFWVGRDRMVG